MKKILLLNIFTFCILNFVFPQGGVWTWISGDSTFNSPGVYGTQGIPSVNNHPPGAYEYSEWKDKQGNFWIYGGCTPQYCDVWKYNPITNEWTWVKGNGLTGQLPVYGTQGVPNLANTPGVRWLCAPTWVDTTGNLWIFGGSLNSAAFRNDLWEYNISSNEWTWVNGDTTVNTFGVHGMQGISSPSNVISARSETSSAWTDSLNNLWLFGGEGYDDVGTVGYLNDLMKYNIITNEWTWMSGSAIANSTNIYGIKGVPNATNVPGARLSYTKWKDTQSNLWLFGGVGNNYYNDMWKYDAGINQWTWMAGTNLPDDSGVYLNTCVYDTINLPASRHEQRAAVTDNCGRFWMFGGLGGSVGGCLNDLWLFNPLQLEWNWISGTDTVNQPGNYGSLGIASVSNIPSSRSGAVAWWGNDNRFYMFGGYEGNTGSHCGDLWVFTPDTSCIGSCSCNAVTPPITQIGDTLFVSANYTNYQWYFGSTLINGATNYFYVAQQSGNYNIVVTDSNGCDVGAGILNVVAGISAVTNDKQFEVFPNPTQNNFIIKNISSSEKTLLQIINVFGEIVYTEKLFGKNEYLIHTNLSSGVYFVQVSDERKTIIQKLVVE